MAFRLEICRMLSQIRISNILNFERDLLMWIVHRSDVKRDHEGSEAAKLKLALVSKQLEPKTLGAVHILHVSQGYYRFQKM